MKQINTKYIQKNILILALVFIMVALLASASYLYIAKYSNRSPEPKNETQLTDAVDYTEPTSEEAAVGSEIKKATVDKDLSSKESSSDSNAAGDSTTSTEVSITAAYRSGENVRVQTLITPITTSGTCKLEAKSASSQPYSETVEVQALPSSSTCKGFTIPISKLSTGLWIFNVTFTDGNNSASASKELNL